MRVRSRPLEAEASEDLRVDGHTPPAMVLTGTLRRYAQMASVICGEDGGSPQVERRGTPSGADGGDRHLQHRRQYRRWQGRRDDLFTGRPRLPYPAAARRRSRPRIAMHRLNELCRGSLLALLRADAAGPSREYEARSADKLHYRYPASAARATWTSSFGSTRSSAA